MRKDQKTDIGRARRFGNVLRSIEDLSTLSDGGEFGSSFGDN